MTPPRRAEAATPRVRRNREAEVTEAAIEVFFDKGFAGASIQDVADRVGVLKGSLYYYIDSKEDLLFRIFDESHRQAVAMMEEAAASEGPALERLRAYLERYVRWYLLNIKRVSLYFSEWKHLTGDRHKQIVAQRRVYDEFVLDLIEQAKAAGEVDPGLETRYAAFFVLGAVNAVPSWYRARRERSPDVIAAAYADMAVGMLVGTRPRTA
jgi:AcrR family transcriptional regulator